MTMRSTSKLAALTAVPAALAAAVVLAAPASADHVGDVNLVEARCAASPYALCLYHSGFATAWWGTNVAVSNLADPTVHRFFAGTGTGAGQQVKNNATHIACDASTTTICYVFYSSRFTGPSDHLYGKSSGRLADTYSENASVRISWGA
ncbi:hypothetical protein ACTG9Q_31115 [Actinokineospora sp. 24-640]